jgi:hypothetical protein
LAGAHAKVGELVKEVYKSQGKRGK